MTKLTSYTCAKCGGILNVDSDQAIFECPFCGNGFNLSDFHRKEVLIEAAQNLKNKEFRSAKKKYEDLFAADRNDFEAKRGLVLANGGIRSIDVLKDPEKLLKTNLKVAKSQADIYHVKSDPQAASYFGKMSEIFARAELYGETQDKVSSIRKFADQEIRSLKEAMHRWWKIRLIAMFIVIGTAPFLLTILPVAFTGEQTTEEEVFTRLFITAIVLGFLILITRIPYEQIATNDEGNTPEEHIKAIDLGAKERSEPLEKSLSDLRTYFEKAYSELQEMEQALLSEHSKEKPEVQDQVEYQGLELQDKVTCSRCGGFLYADKNRNLLICRSCGVAYGTSLFLGNTKKRALEALNAREFNEAEQRYQYVLMLDPHDFAALRGLILCSAKCTRFEVVADTVTNRWLKIARSKIDHAVANALECDKPYFKEYLNVIDGYEKVIAINSKIKPLEKEYKDQYEIKKKINYGYENADYMYEGDATYIVMQKIAAIEEKLDALKLEKDGVTDSIAASCGQIYKTDEERLGLNIN